MIQEQDVEDNIPKSIYQKSNKLNLHSLTTQMTTCGTTKKTSFQMQNCQLVHITIMSVSKKGKSSQVFFPSFQVLQTFN